MTLNGLNHDFAFQANWDRKRRGYKAGIFALRSAALAEWRQLAA
jgi:hypothetical protein